MIRDAKAASNWIRIIVEVWAMTLCVLLHRRFGRRYIDYRAALGLVLIFFYPIFWREHDPRPMLALLLFYLLMLLRARIEGLWRGRRGEVIHSRYNGESRVASCFPKLDELTLKSRAEPLYVLGCGLGLLPFMPPLAMFLIIGAACLWASVQSELLYERAKAEQTFDAMIDAQQHAERVRKLSGEHF